MAAGSHDRRGPLAAIGFAEIRSCAQRGLRRCESLTERSHRRVAAISWLAVLVALAGGFTAAGAVGSSSPEFKGSGLCKFALHGFALTPQSETSINQAVEQLIERHEAAFGFRRSPDFRLKMRVYNRFEDFTNSPGMRDQTNLQGVYVSRTKEIVTFRQEMTRLSLGITLLHEASHAILDQHFRRLQPWLAEGAADYFALVLARNSLTTNLLHRRTARLKLWLADGKLPKLADVLNATHDQWTAINPEQAYAVSWSIVQFLMSSDSNRRVMNAMFWEWQELRAWEIDCAAQLERLYPNGLKAFETAWRHWIERAPGR